MDATDTHHAEHVESDARSHAGEHDARRWSKLVDPRTHEHARGTVDHCGEGEYEPLVLTCAGGRW